MPIAVFDIGKTNIKLSIVTIDGKILERRSATNRQIQAGPYKVMDLLYTEQFLFEGLRAFGRDYRIDDIITTTHGCLGYLLLRNGAVVSLPDYESIAPHDVQLAYAGLTDPYPARGSQIVQGVLHSTCQLLWWGRLNRQAFGTAQFFLSGPQYWAWRLSGVAASEVTTLAALSHLWDVPNRSFAPIVARLGWDHLMPDVRPAWEALGLLTAEHTGDLGLQNRPRIRCGLHDSSANFYRCQAAGTEKLTLLSSGTWLVGFSNERAVREDGEHLGVSLNADVTGRPVSCALSMAGREYATISEEQREDATLEDVLNVIVHRQFAVPSFAEADGFFPRSRLHGHFVGPELESRSARRGLALLYIALSADVALELLGSSGLVFVDGPIARSALFGTLLSQMRPDQDIILEDETAGATVGAALVVGHNERCSPVANRAHRSDRINVPGLNAYRAEWRAICAQYFDSHPCH